MITTRRGLFSLVTALTVSISAVGNAHAEDARVIEHAMGSTEISGTPERVIVLDNGALDNLLALGVKPVGAAPIFLDKPFTGYLVEQAEGVEKVGTINEPNLESIAVLAPDLIIGSKDVHEAIYDRLSQIAPTVYTEDLAADWRGRFALHAAAVNKAEAAETALTQYDAAVSEFKENANPAEISVLRGRGDGIVIYLEGSWSGGLIEELGLARPEAQSAEGFSTKVTEEQIADLDGDHIIWFSRSDDNYMLSTIQQSRLWNTLKAVEAEHVHRLDAGTWLSGMGIQARTMMVNDMKTVLAK
ncbi:iron complex transport system substrate-binding protein [Aliiroseovarius halocynthiae]|nr:iron-siderophore ABC transporter substrate-binding protein [Aliiroseovarius halocynthiae]SMR71956.1 iron complex transport system substrate-binding protein [Aliiroseovarius halocynthiae]